MSRDHYALTVRQPFAQLIVADADTLPPGQFPKRVENRNWPTDRRGEVLIHAGKSTKWFEPCRWSITDNPVPLGCLVGAAEIVDCLSIEEIERQSPALLDRWPWLANHAHCVGRFCFVLENVRRLQTPIAWPGALGFFTVPFNVLKDAVFVPTK